VRRAIAAAAAAALTLATPALGCSNTARPDPRVPTWRALFGRALGSREATGAQINRYMSAIDRASTRVRVVQAGRSTQGRAIRYAIVGTPAHIAPAKLAALAGQARAVRDGTASGAAVDAFAKNAPAFAWVGGTVHGNEPSGGDADMQLLHDLAAGRTCRDQRELHSLVVFVLPMQNPDGRALGTHVDAAWFDINRDWFAMTQPETQAKIAALETYPPVMFADQHEENGTGFFFPPNADPVHHEISAAAVHAIDDVIAPRLKRAFRAHHDAFTNYDVYDLFFMGYGDTVPSTLFGAAGMTFEKGGAARYQQKFAQHLLAAETAVEAVAVNRYKLLLNWGRQWGEALAQGGAGTLQPNRIVQPGDTVRFQVPDTKVHGYALLSTAHPAEALALARRLTLQGVAVQRLTQPVAVSAYRAYGTAPETDITLPAGTFVVSMAQTAKHWVQAMLGEDPYAPFPYFYDVSSWSNPLLMGLEGGVLQAPFAIPAGASEPVKDEAPGEPSAAAYAWPGDSSGAIGLALALTAKGATVTRQPDGSFATTNANAPALAAADDVTLAAAGAPPAGGRTLHAPKVAMLADDAGDDSPGELSAGWAKWVVEHRFGLNVTQLSARDVAAGKLGVYDTLLVPDGSAAADAGALPALQTWVRAGGRLIGWRGRGVALARAAGLTAVTTVPPPSGFTVPGNALRVDLNPLDPVAAGEQAHGWVFDVGDPILAANGAPVVTSYPSDQTFFVSGYTVGSDALKGTPAATDESVGQGRVVLFAFDPAFRAYTEGTERLLGDALLAPGLTAVSVARRVRPVEPALLATASDPGRDAVVVVDAEDLPALLRAARAAGVPSGYTLERDLTTVALRVRNPRGLSPQQRPWTLRLPRALAAAGVRPLLAAF
jgi:hypothetical protein